MPPSVGDGPGQDLAETGRGPAALVGGTHSDAHPGFVSSSFASYRHERVPTPTPAVGEYDLSGSMLRDGADANQLGSSSLLSETRRHVRDLQRERQPGPGAYDPHLGRSRGEASDHARARARSERDVRAAAPRSPRRARSDARPGALRARAAAERAPGGLAQRVPKRHGPIDIDGDARRRPVPGGVQRPAHAVHLGVHGFPVPHGLGRAGIQLAHETDEKGNTAGRDGGRRAGRSRAGGGGARAEGAFFCSGSLR